MERQRESTPGTTSQTTGDIYQRLHVHKGEKINATNGYLGDLVELMQARDSGKVSHLVVEQRQSGSGRLYVPVDLVWDTEGDEVAICVTKEEALQLTRMPPQFVH